jgi:hypothetical protein
MNIKDDLIKKLKESYLLFDEKKEEYNNEKKRMEKKIDELSNFERLISRQLEERYDRLLYDLKESSIDSDEEINMLRKIFNSYYEANKSQFLMKKQDIDNKIETLRVEYNKTVKEQEMQIDELEGKIRKLNEKSD